MHKIAQYLPFLNSSGEAGPSVDLCHAVLLLGAIMSAKPSNVLELGIGPGFTSEILVQGLAYNQKGNLTCIDNYHDLGGHLNTSIMDSLKERGVRIVAPISEKEFVHGVPENTYDFLMSDGDHEHAGEWVHQIFKIIKPDSFMFFHDVAAPGYPNLYNYKTLADELGKPNYLFKTSSRPGESCERGFLMVINKK
jgi:predicted O-methyltransferase YrrM